MKENRWSLIVQFWYMGKSGMKWEVLIFLRERGREGGEMGRGIAQFWCHKSPKSPPTPHSTSHFPPIHSTYTQSHFSSPTPITLSTQFLLPCLSSLFFPTSLHFPLLFSLFLFSKVSFLFLIPFFLELRNFLLCIFIHLFCIFIHTEFLISFLLSIEGSLYSKRDYFNS